MATKAHKTKTKQATLAGQMSTGAAKHFQPDTPLLVAGTTIPASQAEAKLKGYAQLRADVVAARAVLDAKLAAEAAQEPEMNAFVGAFEKVVRASFGAQPDVLADFGLKPPKARAPLTVEEKAAAKAKRASTREARGTKGSKQKAAIHGNVTGVDVTPVTAAQAAAPVATPSPAPASPSPAQPPATSKGS
jgi:hypothetical protein